MAGSPDIVEAVDEIRAALIAIERELTPGVNVEGYSHYVQADFPYWTNRIYSADPEKLGTQHYQVTFECQCLYHIAPVTSGIEGEVEIDAQRMMARLSLLFATRPLLESADYPQGIAGLLGLDGGGVGIGAASIVRSTVNNTETLAVAVPVSVPVTMLVETEY